MIYAFLNFNTLLLSYILIAVLNVKKMYINFNVVTNVIISFETAAVKFDVSTTIVVSIPVRMNELITCEITVDVVLSLCLSFSCLKK